MPPGGTTTPSKAFHPENPLRPNWIESTSVERTRIESYETWRKLKESEYQEFYSGALKCTPTALLLTRKRCGRYKSRLVVLGNRWSPTSGSESADNSLYASVISQLGNKVNLVCGARKGWRIRLFDISNAFLRADMSGHRVVVSVPEQFRNSNDQDPRRFLLKALYGLPVSPRLWMLRISADLRSMGFEESVTEPGLWRLFKGGECVATLSLYVDDACVLGESDELVDDIVSKINKMHPLTMVETTNPDPKSPNRIRFDMLGSDCDYDYSKNFLRITMSTYIKKLLKKMDMGQEGLKSCPTPEVDETALWDDSSPKVQFDYRSVVGALQWCVSVARPDLAQATNCLSRACARSPTRAMVNQARRVLRYMAGATELGIT